jgi:hypothetical protein
VLRIPTPSGLPFSLKPGRTRQRTGQLGLRGFGKRNELEKCWRGAKRRRLVLTPALSFEERENGSSSHGMLGQGILFWLGAIFGKSRDGSATLEKDRGKGSPLALFGWCFLTGSSNLRDR